MGRPRKMKARLKRQGGSTKPQPDSSSHGFTMQQQARNTEGRTRTWSALRLRHKAIHFVSANDVQSDNAEDHAAQESDGGQQESKTSPETPEAPEASKTAETPLPEAVDTAHSESITGSPKFFIDLEGESVKPTGLPNPVPRLHSPDFNDSSDEEEVIVFRGRNRGEKPMSPLPGRTRPVDGGPQPNPSNRGHCPELKNEAGPSEPLKPFLNVSSDNGSPPLDIPMPPLPLESRISSPMDDADNEGYMELNPAHVDTGKHKTFLDDVDIVADYIANIDQDYVETDTEGSESEDVNIDNPKEQPPPRASNDATGADYLDPAQTDHIEQNNVLHTTLSESSENWSDQSSDLQLEDPDIYLDSDLELEGSIDDDFDHGENSLRAFRDLELAVEDGPPYQPRRARNNRWKQRYPSATSFADALELDPYYGLDIMDFDRPSLTQKGKGKRRNAALMLSDSELDSELERAWQNDREKKKTKKQKRQELRSQGLLGRSADKPDLNAKYSGGMDIDDLKVELRTFVLSSRDNLPLPSMDKQRRKLVHDVANALSLKSQSRGNGPSRFPVLYKTSRTPKYTPKTIFRFEKVFSGSKFSNRMVKAWGRQDSSKSTKASRGRPKAAFSYTDGDVVGASAPEIGTGNKGRAMLEKMGWSTGTALGATNNKGILQPVAHVVKNSRVGLG